MTGGTFPLHERVLLLHVGETQRDSSWPIVVGRNTAGLSMEVGSRQILGQFYDE